MKIIYEGKYDGDENSLPNRPHREGAVQFKEFSDMKKFAIAINIMACILTVIFIVLVALRAGYEAFNIGGILGSFAALLTMFPHEFLHAICFKEDAHIYTNLKQGMLFVFGAEDMSKGRFIFMSLLPNMVFGFIPFIVFMIFPSMTFFGMLGALSIGMGSGDYYNVVNALVQVPKNAKIYMYGFHSYWYMPKTEDNENVDRKG